VSECPSLQLELEQEIAALDIDNKKLLNYSHSYLLQNPSMLDYEDDDEYIGKLTLAYFEVRIAIGGLYD
jgi:hypothetical protein